VNITEQHIPCENCGSSDAKCIWADGHGYCFSCNHYYPSDKETFLDTFSYEYLSHRGIDKSSFAFFDVKTKINSEGKPVCVGFKYPNNAYKIRDYEEKNFRWEPSGDTSKAGLFGRNKFAAGSHKYVTITEGEYDAISLWQVLRSPVVSVQSSATGRRDCSLERDWLNSFDRIYLAFDSDSAGRDCARAVAKLFDFNKVYLVKFSNRKDANEYLMANEADELRNIWYNSKKYLPETIVSTFQDFEAIIKVPHKRGIDYPTKTLTEMTYGIRTGESVLITAQEGVGKTEFMHTIEHHILRGTTDDISVGAIFLEEPKKRHLQALAGIELKKPAHLPDSGVTDSEVLSALGEVIKKDDRLYVYSHFGSDDPDSILDSIRFLVSVRQCRYIMFDHITMAVSGLAGDDERRALDYLSTRLEMMVKELDFALLMVSHVNDNGQTRGSRYISKIADIRIDLTRDVENGSFETFVNVSKNRFCGRTGPAGVLVFDPVMYVLTERTDLIPVNDNSTTGTSILPDLLCS
jgi:twinkle protein